ncbi:MAG: hypothetical protein ABII00_09120 [Elusimicrobiota bacterium]
MNENETNSPPLDGAKTRGRQPKKILLRVSLTLAEVRDLGKLQLKLMSETGKETDRDRVIGYAISFVAKNHKADDEPVGGDV